MNAGSNKSAFSTADLATMGIFTDDPLVAGTTTVKAVHIAQLRTAVDALRTLTSLGGGTYTGPSPLGVPVQKISITHLRTALDTARGTLGLGAGILIESITTNATAIKAAQIQDWRTASSERCHAS